MGDAQNEWVAVPEAALRLRISIHTLYRFIAVGRLPAYRINGQVQVRKQDIDNFILQDRRIKPWEVERFLEPSEELKSARAPNYVTDYRAEPLEDDGVGPKLSWFGDRSYYEDESLWVYSLPPEGNWVYPLLAALFALMPLLALAALPSGWVVNPWGRGVLVTLLMTFFVTSFRLPLLLVIQRSQIRSLRGTYRGLLLSVFGGLVARFLGTFATLYWIMSVNDSKAFEESLSRIDALYFAVTTFATTGFGDIVAASGLARSVVTGQMVIGFVVVTVLIALAFRLGEDPDVHILPTRPTLHFHSWPFF